MPRDFSFYSEEDISGIRVFEGRIIENEEESARRRSRLGGGLGSGLRGSRFAYSVGPSRGGPADC